MIRRPPRSTQSRSSAASDVYKRQVLQTPACYLQPLSGLSWLFRMVCLRLTRPLPLCSVIQTHAPFEWRVRGAVVIHRVYNERLRTCGGSLHLGRCKRICNGDCFFRCRSSVCSWLDCCEIFQPVTGYRIVRVIFQCLTIHRSSLSVSSLVFEHSSNRSDALGCTVASSMSSWTTYNRINGSATDVENAESSTK